MIYATTIFETDIWLICDFESPSIKYRLHTPDKATMKGREFLLFLDLVMGCEMSAEIREAKLERPMTVESAISIADCVQTREYNSVRMIREINKKERRSSRRSRSRYLRSCWRGSWSSTLPQRVEGVTTLAPGGPLQAPWELLTRTEFRTERTFLSLHPLSRILCLEQIFPQTRHLTSPL